MSQYTEASIYTPTGLDYVRLRPTVFFPSTGIEGLLHAADEIIVNGIDEIALMPGRSGKLVVMLCVDAERGTYQMVVQDNGRGVPIGDDKFLDSFTKRDTSAKFNSQAYQTSGGLYGQGAKATAGTSVHFRPITHRPERSASFYIHQGHLVGGVEFHNKAPVATGTTIIFEPDPFIFTTDIGLFSEEGQAHLITKMQKFCFFHQLNIEFAWTTGRYLDHAVDAG